MADPVIVASQFKRKVQIAASTTVVAGDLLYHDGTAWAKADASAAASYAQLVALESGDGDASDFKDEVEAAPYALIYDADAPYTQDEQQYLSATAGAITETAPTGASDIVQVVGKAWSTDLIEVNIKPPQEVTVQLPVAAFLATAAYLVQDTGPAAGITLAAANDSVQYVWRVPRNCVEIVDVILGWSANIALDASDTYSVSSSSAADGEANDAVTDSIAAAALTVAIDTVTEDSIVAATNAAGFGVPGDWVHFDINKDAEGSAGDDPVIYGISLTYLQV